MTVLPAPVIVLPHNWEANVQRVLTWRTNIITHRDGSEQRRRVRSQPVEELTYQITLTTQEEAAQLAAVLWNIPDMRVAFPRWEDALMLNVDAVATDTTLTLERPVGPRSFATDALVLIDGVGFERITIDSIAGDTLTLLDPLAEDWPAGSTVVPLVTGYVRSPVAGQDSSQLIGDVSIVLEVEEDVAGVTDGGAKIAMVPASISVYPHAPGSESYIAYGDVQALVVEVKDAAGHLIPNPDLTYDELSSGSITVYPSGMADVVNVRNNRTSGSGSVEFSITFTAGTVVYTYDVKVQ